MQRARILATLVASALASGACAGRMQTAPSPSPRTAFRITVDSLVDDRSFRSAQWGLLVVDPITHDTILSHNAGKLFVPASNQKILTSATALALLGPEFRFVTRFATNGTVHDATLDGDLIVIGRGDPTFSDAMRGDFRNAFREMADSLATRGITRIRGSLRRAGDAFPDDQYGYGWEFDDQDEPYGAGIDELFVNEGFVRALRPNVGHEPVIRAVAIRDHASAFLGALRDALAERTITLVGDIQSDTPVSDSGLTTLFTLSSVTLRQILPHLMKPSQNQIAEIFYKTLALEKTGVGSADSARRIVERQLTAWGAEPDGFVVRDGSGLSRHDFVTPETIVRVLDAMRLHRDFPAFYESLPIAGVDGTLGNRMKGTAADHNVRAKTGTVDKARSLSGYVTTADGHQLLFSFLCNNFTVPNRDVERVQDAILVWLASRPFPAR
jgi:D-alanyl-D-alanine carboxypeptidase/D-alanyl-D-alanine-endopeptidase (penicillin-binding protein 4)